MRNKIPVFLLLFISMPFLHSQTELDSLKTKLETASGSDRIELLNQISSQLLLTDHPETSRPYIEAALQEAAGKSRSKTLALNNLGLYLKEISEYDSAYVVLQEASQLAENYGYQELLPDIYSHLGSVLYKLSQWNEALGYNQKAVLQESDERKNTNRLLNIGKIYFYQGDLNQALFYYQKAGDNAEHFADDLGCANACKEIGTIYNKWGKYSEAREYYFKALQSYEKLDDKKQTANILNEIGSNYRKEKAYHKAIEYQEKSLQIKKEINYKYGMAASLNGLGISWKMLGEYSIALKYYHEALQIQEEIKDEMGAAATISNIGLIYQAMGDDDQALRNFLKSEQLARKIGYNELLINNLLAISDVYETKNDFQNALSYFSLSVTIKDSIFNQDKHKQFAEMQTKYETVEKEKENEQLKHDLELNNLIISRQKEQRNFLLSIVGIILIFSGFIFLLYKQKLKAFRALQKANDIIRRQKQELEIMNKTRDRFFSIIAHDLRNSIGSTQMGVELLDNTAELSAEELNLVVGEMKTSVKNLSNLLENLLAWARLQIGKTHADPVCFDLTEIVQEISATFKAKLSQKNLALNVDLPAVNPIFADRNMVRSILHNLLSNAIKFSHENAEIRISQKIDDKNFRISISDDGVGMSEDMLSRLFRVDEVVTTPGTYQEKGTGLGLILCQEFAEQNGGKIRMESKFGSGTTATLILPVGAPAEI
ncbi:MAG TPA: tetratricopeptide repeat-containing sensor histidine kinase [Candidatus Cloacimonadota bacterium]|nr:tetratricopeptide repeat-containing sensor histidine kinase [Candidatus Cloacimonadota bacterium]